jgi:F-type H+-transporting ATPase subunit b
MINIDATFFVQLAIFLAFVFYLNAVLIRPMGAYLDRRKRTIEEQRSSGSEQDTELEDLQSGYTRRITAARDEMLSRRSEARKEAMTIQNSLLDEARKEANAELAKAEKELAGDITAARGTLETQARTLAALISEKILGRACQ